MRKWKHIVRAKKRNREREGQRGGGGSEIIDPGEIFPDAADAWQAGYDAYKRGESLAMNQFEIGTPAHDNWKEGHGDAFCDSDEE